MLARGVNLVLTFASIITKLDSNLRKNKREGGDIK